MEESQKTKNEPTMTETEYQVLELKKQLETIQAQFIAENEKHQFIVNNLAEKIANVEYENSELTYQATKLAQSLQELQNEVQ